MLSVSCTACKDVIDVRDGTHWCRCGKTFVTKGADFYTWGGPGTPRTHEDNEKQVAGFARDVEEKP